METSKKHGEAVWHGEAVEAKELSWVVLHLRVMDKNQEGYLGSEQSQLQAKPYIPGFQPQEDKPS